MHHSRRDQISQAHDDGDGKALRHELPHQANPEWVGVKHDHEEADEDSCLDHELQSSRESFEAHKLSYRAGVGNLTGDALPSFLTQITMLNVPDMPLATWGR